MAFTYNRTFGEDPHVDSNTEEAWDSIVPRRPQVHTLSWSIHRNFYAAMHNQASGDGTENTSAHMRHCFDYLRQSLMCAADATLEPVDPNLGGVTGWDNARVCRDYGELAAWAESHRVNNLRGFSHMDNADHQ
ncbi:hypothetical protein SLS53_004893 [Cytospora paraplurivora]|uniref:Oxidase ustYa n=1 Tax=Cytospora paraplurivora TaxID=2898453 RepID=A0AAN9UE99_9PEZI